jgi:hypothetical protein
MTHKPEGIAVLHERIFTGDAFIDRHQDFLLSQQLKQMAETVPLSLNDLPYGHRPGQLAG